MKTTPKPVAPGPASPRKPATRKAPAQRPSTPAAPAATPRRGPRKPAVPAAAKTKLVRKPARKPTKVKTAAVGKPAAEARPIPAAESPEPATVSVKPAPLRRPKVPQAKAEVAVPAVAAVVASATPKAARKAGTKATDNPAAKPKRVRQAVAAVPSKRKPVSAARPSGKRVPASGALVPSAAATPKARPVPAAQRPLPLELLRGAPAPQLPPIPPILLEGDPPVVPIAAKPAAKPAAVPRAAVPFPSGGSLWLTVRDPFCVCAHWDFAAAALAAYAAAHRGGGWRLRVWADSLGGHLVNDQPLPAEATHRFVPVLRAGAGYHTEVGFRHADGAWLGLAVSRPATTPPDGASAERTVTLATLPPEPVTPETLRRTPPDAPDAPAVVGHPATRSVLLSLPDLAKAAQLTALVRREWHRTAPGNSVEVTELVGEHVVLPGGAKLGPTAGGRELAVSALPVLPSSESAPPPALPAPRGFWFKVNAEVILHGSTERDARVTIGGRPVKLREDGSFSFRFALPDGEFTLPVVAVNAAGDDGRGAEVSFSRATVLRGEVGTQPQDSALRPPTAAAVG